MILDEESLLCTDTTSSFLPKDASVSRRCHAVSRLINEVGDIRNQIFHFRTERHDPDVDEALLDFAHSYFADRIS